MSCQKCLAFLFFLLTAVPLHAQTGNIRQRASFGLEGPVRKLRETVYISHNFRVDGLHFKEAEKSSVTGFSEMRFDSAGNMTYFHRFREYPFEDWTDSFEFDRQLHLVAQYGGASGMLTQRTSCRYNFLGQLVAVRQLDDTGALFCETAYRYRGGLLSEEKTYSRAYVVIAETDYSYDSLKRLVREEALWNPYRYSVPYVKEYAYDANGTLSCIRYLPREKKDWWTYRKSSDANGRICSESTYDASDSLLKIHNFRYGFRGRLVQEEADDGKIRQDIRYRYRKGRVHVVRNRFGDTDFRTFYLRYDSWGNWVEKAEYDGINLQVTVREITYQPLKMKKTAPSRQSPAQR